MRTLTILAATVALVAACSSKPKPPPEEPKPEPPKVVEPEPEKPPELAEAELCGKLIDRFKASGQMPPEAMAKVIPIVETHCPTWPESARRCLVTAPDDEQEACMKDVDPAARDKFFKDLMASMREPPECTDLGKTASLWTTLPEGVVQADADLANAAVAGVIVATCRDAAWKDEVKFCIEDATTTPRVCLDSADPTSTKLDAELKRRTDLFAAAAAFKPTDKKIGCDKAVAKLTGAMKDKKAAKAAKKTMTKACKDEAWTPFVRGCVVAAKSAEEQAWCVDTSKLAGAEPAAAASTGMPD